MIFLIRVADSGLLPWSLLGIFFLSLIYILTRNLDSNDTLTFLAQLKSINGLAWAGWVFAIAEIPIAGWAINRARTRGDRRIVQLENENERARTRLKQAELDLK